LRFQRRDRLAKVTLHLDRVLPRKVAPRARHDVLRLRLELLCPLAHRARRLFVACHCGPGSLHQLVGVAPEEHRPALIHELRPIVVQLVVHDPLGVIDAPVQSHVETEGEEAHGVGFYEKRAQRAAARAIDTMPHPRWVSARRNSTPSNRSSRPAARGRAATRHDRRDPPSPLRTARNNRMPPTQSPLATAHRAQKLDTIESITRICCALRAETRPHRGRYSTRFVERIPCIPACLHLIHRRVVLADAGGGAMLTRRYGAAAGGEMRQGNGWWARRGETPFLGPLFPTRPRPPSQPPPH